MPSDIIQPQPEPQMQPEAAPVPQPEAARPAPWHDDHWNRRAPASDATDA